MTDPVPEPGRDLIVLNGWLNETGDVISAATATGRHRSGATVRIVIDAQADKADAARIIRKAAAWVERDNLGASR
jgi:hypothetical protein